MALLRPNFHFGKLIRYYEVLRTKFLFVKTVISYAHKGVSISLTMLPSCLDRSQNALFSQIFYNCQSHRSRFKLS